MHQSVTWSVLLLVTPRMIYKILLLKKVNISKYQTTGEVYPPVRERLTVSRLCVSVSCQATLGSCSWTPAGYTNCKLRVFTFYFYQVLVQKLSLPPPSLCCILQTWISNIWYVLLHYMSSQSDNSSISTARLFYLFRKQNTAIQCRLLISTLTMRAGGGTQPPPWTGANTTIRWGRDFFIKGRRHPAIQRLKV